MVLYSSATGSIMYVLIGKRLDLAYLVGVINRDHYNTVKWVLKYIRGTQKLKLNYVRKSSLKVKGFYNYDYATDLDKRRLVSGYVFIVGRNVLSWMSGLQHVAALLTIEAEYMALTKALKRKSG
ncbi:secreted RxLR effector protein 161-like [Manihot esculenta]|uniref:secreted RxLR effector protein 161-like n=1 Tax=Manihot esculenta TaxID=3983 RepID=UPI001CC705E9|nr:secreted RxLR effector protein 161-like [Manihot esculenta]